MKNILFSILLALSFASTSYAQSQKIFSPVADSTTIAATASSGGTTLTGLGAAVLITNAGPNVAFIKLGEGTQTAAVTNLPVLPYTAIIVRRNSSTHVAAICAATQTATVYFTTGDGGA